MRRFLTVSRLPFGSIVTTDRSDKQVPHMTDHLFMESSSAVHMGPHPLDAGGAVPVLDVLSEAPVASGRADTLDPVMLDRLVTMRAWR